MDNLNVSWPAAPTGPRPGDRDSRDRLGIPAFPKGRIGLLLAVAALGAIGLFAGWQWFGPPAILPLLYILPCAAMMMMCMRGHGGTDNPPANSNSSTAFEPDKTP